MKTLPSLIISCIGFSLMCFCSKKETTKNCSTKTIQIQTTPSDVCKPTGTIVVNIVEKTENIKYSINQTVWQTSNTFTNIAAGKKTISVLDDNGCLDTTTITIPSVSVTAGLLFLQAKQTLVTHCASCHSGNSPFAGLDVNNNCNIVNFANRINERAVLGNPTPMPQNGLIPLLERNKISTWINAGGKIDN